MIDSPRAICANVDIKMTHIFDGKASQWQTSYIIKGKS